MFHRFKLPKKPKDDKSGDAKGPPHSKLSDVDYNRPCSSSDSSSSFHTAPTGSNNSVNKNPPERLSGQKTSQGDPALFWGDISDDVFDLVIAEENLDKKRPTYQTSKPVVSQKASLDLDVFTSTDSVKGQFDSALNLTEMSSCSLEHTSLTQSQKGFTKKKSFTSSSQAHTTEWLRNQLEKLNKECSLLKETISTKDGESKILRDRLHEANMTIEKQQMEKEEEKLTLRSEYEKKLKCLEKDLQIARTEKMIKDIQEKSHIEKLKDCVKVSSPEPPPLSYNLRKFLLKKEKASKASSTLSQKRSENIVSEKLHSALETEKSSCIGVNAGKTEHRDKQDILLNVAPFEGERNIEHLGEKLKSIVYPFIFKEASEEYSFIVLPSVDYYPFNILYRDWSEIPSPDDPKKVQNNLKKIWNIQLELDDQRTFCQKSIKRSRYFTSLKEIYSTLFDVCRLPKWDYSHLVDFIIEHVMKMARELYIALCDPAVMVETTISLRESEIMDQCLDISELKKDFNPFSHRKWKKEVYVDLRRGIALIAAMCDLDKSIGKIVLQKSGFMVDDEYAKKYYETCQLSRTTGKWYDNDLFLSSTMQMSLNTLDSGDLNSIHSTDNFIKENYGVGELTTLFQNLSTGQSHHWKERLNELQKENIDEMLCEYRSRKLSNTLDQQLTSIVKTSSIPTKSDSSLKKCSKDVSNFHPFIESRISDSWTAITDDAKLSEKSTNYPFSTKDSPSSSESVMATLMQKEEHKWISKNLPRLSSESPESISSSLTRMSSQNCVSEMERELLSSAFHNFLKIKTAFTGNENMCYCQSSGIVNRHGLLVGHEEHKVRQILTTQEAQTKKMQQVASPVPSLLSGSSASSYSGHPPKSVGKSRFSLTKRDLAPFKRKQADVCEPLTLQDTADIEDAVSKIYDVDTFCEPRSSSEDSSKSTDQKMKDLVAWRSFDGMSEEPQQDLEFLEVLLEVVQRIGVMRYTSNFNALFAVIIQLLQSCLKTEVPAALLRPRKIFEVILEIIYCRPSPIVVRNLNHLLVQCMPIIGFTRLICTNSHPGNVSVNNERVTFMRGNCFIITMCSLVMFSFNEDDWEIQFQLFRWLAYIFLVDKTTIEYLYSKQKTTSGRCKCVWSLNNTIMSTLAKAAAYYYSCSVENRMTSLLKYQLTEIIEHGIRMVSVIVEIDKYFAKNSFTQYDSFILFLETIIFMNLDDKSIFNLELQEKDLKTVKLLLEEENIARNLKKRSRTSDAIEPEGAKLFCRFQTIWPREMFFSQEYLGSSKAYFDINEED